MKVPRKIDFEDLSLEILELEKEKLFEKLFKNKEPKKYRNMLYELLGVIDFKKRFEINGS
ncbi:MAG: hypothetical protein N3F05_02335 [Candidatus Diapherotrites archaeon]|nr:hypothetical protein [Candidatus Diapherotrites archaeon]